MNPDNNWQDQDWAGFENWLRDQLHRHIVRITFRKNDGTIREMNCTLKGETVQPLIEQRYGDREMKPRRGTNLVVWDLDNNDWRSFVTKRIISVDILEEVGT